MRRALTGQRHPAPGVIASRSCTPSGAVRASRAPRCGASNQCIVYDYSSQLVPYELAWKLQKDLVEESVRALDEEARAHAKGSTSAPTTRPTHSLVILQHPPVYTLGAGSSLDHVKFDLDQPPHPIYRTERGGEVTYHGPGQLVMYPILDLRHLRQDLHWYLRSLEEVVIAALDQVSGLAGERIPGLTGVWVDGSKVAAIGVRAKRWISYHGLALNVCPDLHPFSLITPCGIEDRPVGSVQQLLATSTQAGDDPLAADDVAGSLLLEYRYALLEAFGDVFGLELVHHDAPELLLQNQPQMDAVRH